MWKFERLAYHPDEMLLSWAEELASASLVIVLLAIAFSLFENEVGIWLTTATTDAKGNADGTAVTVSSAGWAGGLLMVFFHSH